MEESGSTIELETRVKEVMKCIQIISRTIDDRKFPLYSRAIEEMKDTVGSWERERLI